MWEILALPLFLSGLGAGVLGRVGRGSMPYWTLFIQLIYLLYLQKTNEKVGTPANLRTKNLELFGFSDLAYLLNFLCEVFGRLYEVIYSNKRAHCTQLLLLNASKSHILLDWGAYVSIFFLCKLSCI